MEFGMRYRTFALLAASALLAGVPSAHGRSTSMTTEQAYLTSPQALADLSRINDHFIENFIRNDVKSHDALLDPRFIVINADGSRTDRATYLREWATGFDPEVIPYWDVRDELITQIGNVALVRSTNKMVLRRDGTETTSMSTYTDTYVYRDGKWRCIQAQITRVSPDKWPSDTTIKTVYLRGVKQ
jgi:hypothetical protein